MELHQIRAFLAVAEELHFGRAAARLHLAQPALSRTIQNLERSLGTPLFERNTRSVRLTTAGEALLPSAADVLEAVRSAQVSVAAAGRGEVGRVRLAFPGASSHIMVGRLARSVRETHPGLDFQIFSSNYASAALDKLAERTIDIGLGRWWFVPPELESRIIADERLIIALPTQHPLAIASSVSMKDLQKEDFVSLARGGVLFDHLIRLAASAGFVPTIAQTAPDTWTQLSLISAGAGCGITVSSVAENGEFPGIVFRPLSEDFEPVLLRMAWRADDASPALRAVLEIAQRELPTPVLTRAGVR
jgi:DNA-binding transcriptional LysR family regulator